MILSVIIPTYKRTKDLQRLFDSLFIQVYLLKEVLVIIGPEDEESIIIARIWRQKFPVLHIINATKASVVHSLNLGLQVSSGEIVCLLGDDVSLPLDWSYKIIKAFENNSNLGAYGGRDYLQLPNEPNLSNPPLARKIGIYKWTGTLIGNHHCGSEVSPIEVDVLKGCNLSFRRSALKPSQIETALESQGAETCWEIDICQKIKLAGFKIIYDNNNLVHHHVATRLDFDNRTDLFSPAWSRRIFNESFITAKYRPFIEIIVFCFRSFLIGSKFQPGIVWSIINVRQYSFKVLMLPWYNTWKYLRLGIMNGLRRRPY